MSDAISRRNSSGVLTLVSMPCDASRCFTRSGIWKAAEEAGAEVVLPAPYRFRTYDLGGAVLEKLNFNKHRPDHKLENRLKEDGKKF